MGVYVVAQGHGVSPGLERHFDDASKNAEESVHHQWPRLRPQYPPPPNKRTSTTIIRIISMGNSPLMAMALFAAYQSIQRRLQSIVPDKRATAQLALRG
jgi:hypothetical protein